MTPAEIARYLNMPRRDSIRVADIAPHLRLQEQDPRFQRVDRVDHQSHRSSLRHVALIALIAVRGLLQRIEQRLRDGERRRNVDLIESCGHSLAPSSVGPDGSVEVAAAAGEGSAAAATTPDPPRGDSVSFRPRGAGTAAGDPPSPTGVTGSHTTTTGVQQ